jgi:hypothetical protein
MLLLVRPPDYSPSRLLFTGLSIWETSGSCDVVPENGGAQVSLG